jgi:methionine biosynthesis protein MetW
MRKLLAGDEGRTDLSAIAQWIEPGSSVLDLGCGEGELLEHLMAEKGVRGAGVDIDLDKIVACVQKGIPVVQKDLNGSLECFETGAYDYVIVSQTIHQLREPDRMMAEILRIGRRAIVSFPNFGHYSLRLQLLASGTMPKSSALPFEWYRTPNIHLMTIADFEKFCGERGIRILRRADISKRRFRKRLFWRNLLSEGTVVLLGRADPEGRTS